MAGVDMGPAAVVMERKWCSRCALEINNTVRESQGAQIWLSGALE